MTNLKTVIFPVAGMGTRMLPATKSVPKELLPVYDTPLLQFAIEEALAAGAEQLIFISHPDKPAIRDYLSDRPDLRSKLAAPGKADLLRAVERSAVTSRANVHIVYQPQPLGLGHAVQCAQQLCQNDEKVGVILPDDVILGQPCLAEMAEAYEQTELRHMVAAMQVPREKTSSYGIFRAPANQPTQAGAAERLVKTAGIVEKPDPASAPSDMAAVGRYILDTSIFDYLSKVGVGAGGEIQLTDAIEAAHHSEGLAAYRFSGTRYDCGSKAGLLQASCAYAAQLQDEADTIAAGIAAQ